MPCFPCQKGAEYLEYEESQRVKNRFRSLRTFYSRRLKKFGILVSSLSLESIDITYH